MSEPVVKVSKNTSIGMTQEAAKLIYENGGRIELFGEILFPDPIGKVKSQKKLDSIFMNR